MYEYNYAMKDQPSALILNSVTNCLHTPTCLCRYMTTSMYMSELNSVTMKIKDTDFRHNMYCI